MTWPVPRSVIGTGGRQLRQRKNFFGVRRRAHRTIGRSRLTRRLETQLPGAPAETSHHVELAALVPANGSRPRSPSRGCRGTRGRAGRPRSRSGPHRGRRVRRRPQIRYNVRHNVQNLGPQAPGCWPRFPAHSRPGGPPRRTPAAAADRGTARKWPGERDRPIRFARRASSLPAVERKGPWTVRHAGPDRGGRVIVSSAR
jgi:hypothetical protein